MARLKLTVPNISITEIVIPVRITDINYGNHLGNDSLVSIIHEARVQWLHQLGYTELNIENLGIIMSDLAVEYKNEAFYGDELSVAISIGDISPVSFELYYHLFNQHKKEIAKAKTGMVCYDYTANKVAAIPFKFRSIIQPG